VLVIAIPALLACPSPARAQLTVIISGGFSTTYRQVLPEFEHSTGITVTTLSGASQGKGPETIAAQLSRGVPADVAILSREGLTELIAAGRIVAGTDADLARAALGVAVRSGAHKPDISTVEAFKQALVSARVVAVPASTSGIYLTTELFPRLGIADKLNVRIMPRGSQSAALVASGDAGIVVQPISELLHVQGLDFVGPIPAELQLIQTFAAAIIAGSKELKASRQLIAFLVSDRARRSRTTDRAGRETLTDPSCGFHQQGETDANVHEPLRRAPDEFGSLARTVRRAIAVGPNPSFQVTAFGSR
jgi:molybdate transport system substrate-binding protein